MRTPCPAASCFPACPQPRLIIVLSVLFFAVQKNQNQVCCTVCILVPCPSVTLPADCSQAHVVACAPTLAPGYDLRPEHITRPVAVKPEACTPLLVGSLAVYKAFKEGQKRILVATDLVGRGIDIERVNIVINYDMPETDERHGNGADTYLHRVRPVQLSVPIIMRVINLV